MQHVQCLAKVRRLDDHRYVGFAGSLCEGNHTDARSAKCFKEFGGYSGQVSHVFAYDGDGSQAFLCFHGEHGSRLNFLGKLFVEHLNSFFGILFLHANAGRILGRSLTNQEHRDALVGQGRENAPVYTNHAHHREAAHIDKRRALDAGYALDGLAVVGYLGFDDGAFAVWVEGVFYLDGDVLDAHGVDGWWINHFGAEVT